MNYSIMIEKRENKHSLLNSSLPLILMSLYIAFLQYKFYQSLDLLTFVSVIRILCNSISCYFLLKLFEHNVFSKIISMIAFCTWGLLTIFILIYTEYFTRPPNLSLILLSNQVTDLKDYLNLLFSYNYLLIIIGLIFCCFIYSFRKTRKFKLNSAIPSLLFSILFLVIANYNIIYNKINPGPMGNISNQLFFEPNKVIEKYGYSVFLYKQSYSVKNNINYNSHLKNPIPFIPHTDKKQNHSNFIIIQIESLDNTLIHVTKR